MTKKILVVDDKPDVLESIKEVLENEGYEVDTVNNGKECIEKAKETKHDLILIDIYMPGMNGEDLFKALRKTINHLTPLVYVTIKPKAEVDLGDVEGFIQKPFRKKELVKAVINSINNFKKTKGGTEKSEISGTSQKQVFGGK